MNIHQLGGPSGQPPSRNEKVSRSRTKSSGSSASGEGQAPRDTVAVDRSALEGVRALKQRILDSPEIRRQKVEHLREQYIEGRLRKRAIFEATAEAILKGQSMLDDLDPTELM